jgi:hypothetical protein
VWAVFLSLINDMTDVNMKETRSEEFPKWLKSTRRLVEKGIGQLAERFNIEKVRVRKCWYLIHKNVTIPLYR